LAQWISSGVGPAKARTEKLADRAALVTRALSGSRTTSREHVHHQENRHSQINVGPDSAREIYGDDWVKDNCR
jgi:hypothetical protein